MFNVYKNQLSRQTGSRNPTGPKTLPTIWYTYMTLVTKYQISAINSYCEKCDEKYLGRTDRGKTVYPTLPLGSGGIKSHMNASVAIEDQLKTIEVSVLISCIASICHVYRKFPLKIKDSTSFLSIVLEKNRILR